MERSPKKDEDDDSDKKPLANGREMPLTNPHETEVSNAHPDQPRRTAIEDLQHQILAAFNRYESAKAEETGDDTTKAPKPEATDASAKPDQESPVWRMPDEPPMEHRPGAESHEDDEEDSEDDDDDDNPKQHKSTPAAPSWPRPVIPAMPRVEHAAAETTEAEDQPEPATQAPASEAVAESTPTHMPFEAPPEAQAETELPEPQESATEQASFEQPETEQSEASQPLAAEAEPEPAAAEWEPPYLSYTPEYQTAAAEDDETPLSADPAGSAGRPPILDNPALFTRDYEPQQWSESAPQPVYNEKPHPNPTFENYDNRRRIAGSFLLGVVLSAYIANRMDKRRAKAAEQQFGELRGQNQEQAGNITHLTQEAEQNRRQVKQLTQENLLQDTGSAPAYFEQGNFPVAPPARSEARPPQPGVRTEAVPPSPEVQAEQLAAAQAQTAEQQALAPGQHVEHSTWHNIVVDKEGREVQGAISYGEAFQRERRSEQMPVAVSDGPQDTPSSTGTQLPAPLSGAVNPMLDLPSGQVPTDRELSAGSSRFADPQHRLPAQQSSQIQSTFTSPWLWLGIGLLIVAFLAAAFL